jgi:hypothetical protein
VKNGFDSAILTKIPGMEKGGWVDAGGLNTCAGRQALASPWERVTTISQKVLRQREDDSIQLF